MCKKQPPAPQDLRTRQEKLQELVEAEDPSPELQAVIRYLSAHFQKPRIDRRHLVRLRQLAAAVTDPGEDVVLQRCMERVPTVNLRPLMLKPDEDILFGEDDLDDWTPDGAWAPNTPTPADLDEARALLKAAANAFKNLALRRIATVKLKQAIELVPDLDTLKTLLPQRSGLDEFFGAHKHIDTFRQDLTDEKLARVRDEVLRAQQATWLRQKRTEHLEELNAQAREVETEARTEMEDANLAEVSELLPIGATLLTLRWLAFVEATARDNRSLRRAGHNAGFRRQAEKVREDRGGDESSGPQGLASTKRIKSFVGHVKKTWANRRSPRYSGDHFAADLGKKINALGKAAHGRRWAAVKIESDTLPPELYGETTDSNIVINSRRIGEFLEATDPNLREHLLKTMALTTFHEARHWEQGLLRDDVYDYDSCTSFRTMTKHRASKPDDQRAPTVAANHNMERLSKSMRALAENQVLVETCGGETLSTKLSQGEVEDLVTEALLLAAYAGEYQDKWMEIDDILTDLPDRWKELLDEWDDFYQEYRFQDDEWDAHLVGDLVEMAWSD